MIIVELVDNDTRERRYSDQKMKLRQIETQVLYDDAVDVIPCKYTYEETDIPIDEEPESPVEPTIETPFGIPPMMIPSQINLEKEE
jgi:hypothetical protein